MHLQTKHFTGPTVLFATRLIICTTYLRENRVIDITIETCIDFTTNINKQIYAVVIMWKDGMIYMISTSSSCLVRYRNDAFSIIYAPKSNEVVNFQLVFTIV